MELPNNGTRPSRLSRTGGRSGSCSRQESRSSAARTRSPSAFRRVRPARRRSAAPQARRGKPVARHVWPSRSWPRAAIDGERHWRCHRRRASRSSRSTCQGVESESLDSKSSQNVWWPVQGLALARVDPCRVGSIGISHCRVGRVGVGGARRGTAADQPVEGPSSQSAAEPDRTGEQTKRPAHPHHGTPGSAVRPARHPHKMARPSTAVSQSAGQPVSQRVRSPAAARPTPRPSSAPQERVRSGLSLREGRSSLGDQASLPRIPPGKGRFTRPPSARRSSRGERRLPTRKGRCERGWATGAPPE